VWLSALGLNESFRPDGWQDTARKLARHEIPFIRDVALRNRPLPLDDATVEVVAEAIEDEFAPVQGSACQLAGKARLKAFGEPLTRVLETTKNDWVLRAAFSAAAECGVANDRRLEICVRRMGRRTNDWNMLLLSLLIEGTIGSHGYSAQAIDDWTSILPGIQSAWLEFIETNRERLREETRFEIASPPLSPKMFPPKFRLNRAGQPAWPEDPNEQSAKASTSEATISGRILLEDGSPARGQGFLYSESSITTGTTSSSSMSTEGQFTGHFSIAVPAGTVWLKYFADDFAPAWYGPIEAKAGETIDDVTIELKKGFASTIRLVGDDGKPIAKGKVVALPHIGGNANGPSVPLNVSEQAKSC
jgi:hypothetical protein